MKVTSKSESINELVVSLRPMAPSLGMLLGSILWLIYYLTSVHNPHQTDCKGGSHSNLLLLNPSCKGTPVNNADACNGTDSLLTVVVCKDTNSLYTTSVIIYTRLNNRKPVLNNNVCNLWFRSPKNFHFSTFMPARKRTLSIIIRTRKSHQQAKKLLPQQGLHSFNNIRNVHNQHQS
jgi:hypothetical protein